MNSIMENEIDKLKTVIQEKNEIIKELMFNYRKLKEYVNLIEEKFNEK